MRIFRTEQVELSYCSIYLALPKIYEKQLIKNKDEHINKYLPINKLEPD